MITVTLVTVPTVLFCFPIAGTVVLGGAFHVLPPTLGPLDWRPSFFTGTAGSQHSLGAAFTRIQARSRLRNT
jgi:hypothetical protein